MHEPEIIKKQEQEQGNGISLQQWLFDRVSQYITGRVLEITDGQGVIAPVCEQNGIQVEVKNINLSDDDFEERYSELAELYDTLIVLNAGEQMKSNRSIVYNATYLLKRDGHLITRLPARTALFNGLNQGFSWWKTYNLEYINKILRTDFSIIKTRYYQITTNESPAQRQSKYSKRISIIHSTDSIAPNETGLSIIVVGRKR